MENERVNYYTERLWNANHTTEIRSILKEFEFECVGQNAATSDEALPIADVVKSLPSENKPRSMSKCMMCGKSNGCQCHGKW